MQVNSYLLAKFFHDLASPISALGMNIDLLEESLPNNHYQQINKSLTDLIARLKIMRFMISNSDSQKLTIIANDLNKFLQIKNILFYCNNKENINFEGTIAAIISGLILLIAEKLPKGGTITLNCFADTVTIDVSSSFLGKIDTDLEPVTVQNILLNHLVMQAKSINKNINFFFNQDWQITISDNT